MNRLLGELTGWDFLGASSFVTLVVLYAATGRIQRRRPTTPCGCPLCTEVAA